MWEGLLIEGELVDTYGGDYTYRYVRADWDGERYRFYEYCLGAKEHDEEEILETDDEYKEYMEAVNDKNNPL